MTFEFDYDDEDEEEEGDDEEEDKSFISIPAKPFAALMDYVMCLKKDEQFEADKAPVVKEIASLEPKESRSTTYTVYQTLALKEDLLRAADQYLLEGLKRLCEYTIAQDVSLENVSSMYELSEAFHVISLRHTCVLFILEHFYKLSARPGHSQIIQRIVPEIRNYFAKALTKPNPHTPRL